jgi:hypothetical protein
MESYTTYRPSAEMAVFKAWGSVSTAWPAGRIAMEVIAPVRVSSSKIPWPIMFPAASHALPPTATWLPSDDSAAGIGISCVTGAADLLLASSMYKSVKGWSGGAAMLPKLLTRMWLPSAVMPSADVGLVVAGVASDTTVRAVPASRSTSSSPRLSLTAGSMKKDAGWRLVTTRERPSAERTSLYGSREVAICVKWEIVMLACVISGTAGRRCHCS